MYSLVLSTLSAREFHTLLSKLTDTVKQVVSVDEVAFYPTLQAALDAAFKTHATVEGTTQHIIFTQGVEDKAIVARSLRAIPERTWIYLIITDFRVHEVEWWRQFVSPQFMLAMVDCSGQLDSN